MKPRQKQEGSPPRHQTRPESRRNASASAKRKSDPRGESGTCSTSESDAGPASGVDRRADQSYRSRCARRLRRGCRSSQEWALVSCARNTKVSSTERQGPPIANTYCVASPGRFRLLRRAAAGGGPRICAPHCRADRHVSAHRRSSAKEARVTIRTSIDVAPKRGRRAKPDQARQRDPRIPAPGSLLIVKQGRQTVRVTVLQAGFEYAGKRYRSLTAVARQVAGRSVTPTNSSVGSAT